MLIIALSPRGRDKSQAIRLALLALALLFLLPAVAAKDAEIDKLSDKLAKIIQKSPPIPGGNRAVLVIDFCESDGQFTQLGVLLAGQVSESLLRKATGFQIIDRQKFRKILEEQKLTPSSLQEPQSVASVAGALQAELFLLGTFSTKPNEIQLSVRVFRAFDSKMIGFAESRIRNVQEMWDRQNALAYESYPKPGKDGYGYPNCESCPAPQYSEASRAKKIQGSVILRVIITAEGKPEHISVVKRLDPALDNKAIEAVKQWRFQPAKGPDGKPVAVRTEIEVVFRLL